MKFLLPAEKSTPLSIRTVLAFSPPTDKLQPLVLTTFSRLFNCATFTASVFSVPADTPVIWRTISCWGLPILTAPAELFHAILLSFERACVIGS